MPTVQPTGVTHSDVSHARLAALVQSSGDAIIGETLDGIITDWNPAAERLYGYTAEEMLGQNLTRAIPPDHMAEMKALLARVHQGESLDGIETVRIRKDGRAIDVALTVSPVWDEEGRVIATSAIVRDISALKANARALADSERRFRTAFTNAPIGMTLVGPDGRILRANDVFCAMLGYDRADVECMMFQELTHPEDIEANLQLIRSALTGEQDTYEMEKRYLRRDGEVVWAHVRVSLVRADDGVPQYLITHIQDITARKEAEVALARERDLLRAVMDHVPDALYVKDVNSRFLRLNPPAAHTLGITDPDDALGKTDFDYFPESLASQYFADEQRVIATGQPLLNRLEPQGEDGATAAWWLTSTAPVRDETGTIVGIVGSGRDITERLHAEEAMRVALEAAQSANRTRRQFLAMMSHELRTPMQAILGYADLLVAQLSGVLTQDQIEDFDHIRGSAGRMITLVGQILDLARLEAGRVELAMKPVDLTTIIDQVEQDVTPQAEAKGIALQFDAPEHLPEVLADATRLRQILLNLAGNAVKFTDDGGVHVSLTATDDEVAVSVQDTGIGIAPEVLPFIFEEFRQAESGMTRRFTGAGLGLTIAQKLAEQHGGRITVASQPDHGSTFTLHLPISHPSQPIAERSVASLTSRSPSSDHDLSQII